MGEIVFSSWGGKVLDQRGGTPQAGPSWMESFHGERLRAFFGWDGFIVADPQLDLIQAFRTYYREVQKESCGRCIPCRIGTRVIQNIFDRISTGEALPEELDTMRQIASIARTSSLCELGQAAAKAALDFLDHYGESLRGALEESRGEGIKVLASGEVVTGGSPEELRYKAFTIAPCAFRCPAHVSIPSYIDAVKDAKYQEGVRIIQERFILVGVLGRVCVHPCEEYCRRQNVDEPISIRVLKRYLADKGLMGERRPRPSCSGKHLFQGLWSPAEKIQADLKVNPQDKKVAIIGAGPAGISAAYHLGCLGYRVTIFEALPVAGGMLAVGIPSYRLPKDILQGEIDALKELGVEIRLNTRVGKDVTLEQLRKDFDAVFIAAGLHESAKMGVEGEDAGYEGFMPGVKFLRDMNLGNLPRLDGKVVAVVGGGNVAMDCARSALRWGAKEVHLIYRRTRAEMPAHVSEVNAAEEEGVIYHFQANPTRLIAENGVLKGVECIRMELGEPDASGRRRPVPVPGSEFFLPCDVLVPAIGQVADLSFLEGTPIEISKWNTIVTDPVTLATNVPGVFAGGDIVLGARTVIEAVAQGNRAAVSIHQYLTSGRVSPTVEDQLVAWLQQVGVYDKNEKIGICGGRPRQKEREEPPAERIKDFREAELGFDYDSAKAEAERCMRCYRVGMMVFGRGGD